MTRLIILPNDQVQLQLESPLPAAELAESINAGKVPEVILNAYPAPIPTLLAVCVGAQVVAFPADPLNAIPLGNQAMLTPRLLAVLNGLADGLTTNQIAMQVGVSARTVEHHITALRKRLGVEKRLQLAARAIALGLISSNRSSS